MRRTGVLFMAPSLLGVVAETPDTIVLDGDMSDWPQDHKLPIRCCHI